MQYFFYAILDGFMSVTEFASTCHALRRIINKMIYFIVKFIPNDLLFKNEWKFLLHFTICHFLRQFENKESVFKRYLVIWSMIIIIQNISK